MIKALQETPQALVAKRHATSAAPFSGEAQDINLEKTSHQMGGRAITLLSLGGGELAALSSEGVK